MERKSVKILSRSLAKLNRVLGIVSGACIALACCLIIAEIVLRIAVHRSLYVTDEYVGYFMAVSSFLGLSFVEMENGHIRMDLIDLAARRIPRLLKTMKILAYAVAFLFAAYLTYVTWELFRQSWLYQSRSMQISATLLAIPQFFLPLGSLTLSLQYLSHLQQTLRQSPSKGQ